jgi:TetR/AcrR family transcriptional regulator, acrAB operon repressor
VSGGRTAGGCGLTRAFRRALIHSRMYDNTMPRRTAAAAAATRRDLIAAALNVFAESGFPSATLEAIAERAGVTRGALYHHFGSKEDIYDVALAQVADQVMQPLGAALAGEGPPLQRIHRFVESYCVALGTDDVFRRAVSLLLAGAPTEHSRQRTGRGFVAFLAAFESVLRQAAESGDLRAGLSPRSAAVSVLACAVGVTASSLQSPELISPEVEARPLADSLVAGLSGKPPSGS